MQRIILTCIFVCGLSVAQTANIITLDNAIDRILSANQAVQVEAYEAGQADSQERQYKQKFTPFLGLEGRETKRKLPPNTITELMGDEQYESEVNGYVGTYLPSGTLITVGAKNVFYNTNDEDYALSVPALSTPLGPITIPPVTVKQADPAVYRPALYATLRQDLWKNGFGQNDRRKQEIVQNATKMLYGISTYRLSGLVAGGIVDFWSTQVRRSALENARLELKTQQEIQAIIRDNVNLGQIESFNLNQFNALVAGSQAKVFMAEQAYRESLRVLARTIQTTVSIEVLPLADLVSPHYLTSEAAVAKALATRADYQAVQLALRNAELQKAISENAVMPSLVASLTAARIAEDPNYQAAVKEVRDAKYTNWEGRIQCTLPLWNHQDEALKRDAQYKYQQASLKAAAMKQEITDEVTNKAERVATLWQAYSSIKTAREQAEIYHQKLMARIRQGSFNSAVIKNAVDGLVQTRQQELEVLVQYNVALLQLEIATNTFYENHGIAINDYVAEVTHE